MVVRAARDFPFRLLRPRLEAYAFFVFFPGVEYGVNPGRGELGDTTTALDPVAPSVCLRLEDTFFLEPEPRRFPPLPNMTGTCRVNFHLYNFTKKENFENRPTVRYREGVPLLRTEAIIGDTFAVAAKSRWKFFFRPLK